MFVGKAVNDAVLFVKTVCDQIEILGISSVIPTKDRIGNVIGYLDQTRSMTFDEKWRIGDVF